MRPLVHTAAEHAALDTMQAGIADWGLLYDKYLDLAAHKNFSQAHDIMVDQIYPILPKVDEAADALNAAQQKLLAEARTSADRQVSSAFGKSAWPSHWACSPRLPGCGWCARWRHPSAGTTRQLLEMSRQVAGAAAQIAQSNESLSQSINQQAASIQKSSAATKEISAMTHRNVSGARNVAALIHEDSGLVGEANYKLEAMLVVHGPNRNFRR